MTPFFRPFLIGRGILLASLAALLASCSGLSTPPGGLGVEHLEARSSGERPVWIDSLGRWQRDHPDREYFVGTTPKEPDQEAGRTDAYENAIVSITQRVGERARSLYQEVSSRQMGVSAGGMDMSVRRNVRSMVQASAKARIAGVRIEEYFWQKFWEKDQENSPPISFYRYHVLVSLSRDGYERVTRKSLEDARDNTENARMKTLLERLLEKEKSEGH
jgi:hypothetical protein